MVLLTILGILGLISLAKVGEGEPEGEATMAAVPIPGPEPIPAAVGDPADLPADEQREALAVPIAGFDDDAGEGEEIEEIDEEAQQEEEEEEAEETAEPPAAEGPAIARDPETEAQFWFNQHTQQAAQVRELQAELARLSARAAPTAPAGSPGATAPVAPGPAALPPPTVDELAARFGTSADDPLVAYALAQEQQQRLLLSELQQVKQTLAPVQQTYAQQQEEQRVQQDFVAWLNDPTQVAPEARAEVAALWPQLRPMFGRRVANWTDGFQLLRAAEMAQAAPAQAFEEGRRQGNTEQAQRRSRGALAAAAAGPISPRKMGTPMVASVDEAFRLADARIGRRR